MPMQRNDSLDQIRRDGAFDVVVVGGGINGIGVYRDLALQGLRVLLVERNDFCSGCSAAPSRMIHGGLRYLENGEFDLVWESLRERDALLVNAPHMVRPLPTTIPIATLFSGLLNGAAGFLGLSSGPASRGALPIKIGLMLYDWTTRHRRLMPKHRFRGARETMRLWPALSPRLRFSATYHDAWISYPERLGVELVLDTQKLAPNCVALNPAELALSGDGFAWADGPSGAVLPVTTRAIVNATGAWLDESLASLTEHSEKAEPYISGTKGSHLILDCPPLHAALDGHMIFRLQEGLEQSRYRVGQTELRFQTKAEAHLPVALASMVCKYIRELSMDLFNRYWTSKVADLAPTKGYPTDAQRFRRDIAAAQQRLGIPDAVLWRNR